MRLISQTGDIDIPYENTVLSVAGNLIFAYVPIVSEKGTVIASYSTKKKSEKVMEMLHNTYDEFTTANIVFQFPKDDEL